MAKRVLMDEFHVTVFAPRGLAAGEYDAIRRTLDDVRFQGVLRRAVCRVVRRFPALHKVRVALSR